MIEIWNVCERMWDLELFTTFDEAVFLKLLRVVLKV